MQLYYYFDAGRAFVCVRSLVGFQSGYYNNSQVYF
jgi:hypothetical protein